MNRFLKTLIVCILINGTLDSYLDSLLLKIAFWQIKGLINFSLIDFLKDISSVKKMDPYAKKKAKVRESESLCSRERKFLKKRALSVKQGVEKFLEGTITEEESPTIALCFSGGGYRAMIGTLAFLNASKDTGLLDIITYISSLSGSTWALSSWLGHNLELGELIRLTKFQISNSITNGIDRRLLVENAIWKLFYGQKMSLVGIWGSIIANVLFNDLEKNYIGSPQMRIMRGKMPRLSHFRSKIDQGNFPMPLFTAVSVSQKYDWLEFSPYEVGLLKQNTYIPSWSFGREFMRGLSTNYAPEHGIDYLMGIWGSAFTASLGEILGHCFDKKLLLEVAGTEEKNPGFGLESITAKFKSEFLKLRLSPAKIKNLRIEDNNPFLTLVDAGIDFNLPLPPLLKKERKLDLIIICDLSSNADTGAELKAAECYAVENGLKFPKIDYKEINPSIINIFQDSDLEVPTVIYMPMIRNESYSKHFDPKNEVKKGGYCSTFNLLYSDTQFDELFGLIEYNLKLNLNTIKKVIKGVLDKKIK